MEDNTQEIREDLSESRTGVAVRRNLLRLVPGLYRIATGPLTRQDKRWKHLMAEIAIFYVETMKARVERQVGRVRAKKTNKVSCGKCFWFRFRQDSEGKQMKGDRFGYCTNPVEKSQVLAFNPYKAETKEERTEMAKAMPVWRATSQTCRSAKKDTDVKI